MNLIQRPRRLRRNATIRAMVRETRLTPDDFSRMAAEQFRIVQATVPLLKPEGVLVYSTCSLEPEENAGVVKEFLASHKNFKLESERALFPSVDHVDGAYVARLRK